MCAAAVHKDINNSVAKLLHRAMWSHKDEWIIVVWENCRCDSFKYERKKQSSNSFRILSQNTHKSSPDLIQMQISRTTATKFKLDRIWFSLPFNRGPLVLLLFFVYTIVPLHTPECAWMRSSNLVLSVFDSPFLHRISSQFFLSLFIYFHFFSIRKKGFICYCFFTYFLSASASVCAVCVK